MIPSVIAVYLEALGEHAVLQVREASVCQQEFHPDFARDAEQTAHDAWRNDRIWLEEDVTATLISSAGLGSP